MKAPKMKYIPSKKVVVDKDYKKEPNRTIKRTIDPRPEFSMSADLVPQIKDWSVGKKYILEIEVEMTGSRIEDWGDDKGKLKASFKISGIMEDKDDDDKKSPFEAMKE